VNVHKKEAKTKCTRHERIRETPSCKGRKPRTNVTKDTRAERLWVWKTEKIPLNRQGWSK